MISNCVFSTEDTVFGGNVNYDVICNEDTFTVRIDQDTDIPGNPLPDYAVDISGALGQYDSSSPYFDGYQLLPRFLTDIVESAPPGITDLVITIQVNDIRLDWTAVPGATLYHIYTSDEPYANFSEIGATDVNWYVIEAALLETQRFIYVTYE